MFEKAEDITIRGGSFTALSPEGRQFSTCGMHSMFHGVKDVEVMSGRFIAGNMSISSITVAEGHTRDIPASHNAEDKDIR